MYSIATERLSSIYAYDTLNHLYDSMIIIDNQFCFLMRDVSPRAQASQHHMLSHNLGSNF